MALLGFAFVSPCVEGANPKCANVVRLKLFFKMCGGEIFKTFGSVSVSPKLVRKFILRCQISIFSCLFFEVGSFFGLLTTVLIKLVRFFGILKVLKIYFFRRLGQPET